MTAWGARIAKSALGVATTGTRDKLGDKLGTSSCSLRVSSESVSVNGNEALALLRAAAADAAAAVAKTSTDRLNNSSNNNDDKALSRAANANPSAATASVTVAKDSKSAASTNGNSSVGGNSAEMSLEGIKKTELVVWVPLSPVQRQLYQAVLKTKAIKVRSLKTKQMAFKVYISRRLT